MMATYITIFAYFRIKTIYEILPWTFFLNGNSPLSHKSEQQQNFSLYISIFCYKQEKSLSFTSIRSRWVRSASDSRTWEKSLADTYVAQLAAIWNAKRCDGTEKKSTCDIVAAMPP